jgi:hypothetical protein
MGCHFKWCQNCRANWLHSQGGILRCPGCKTILPTTAVDEAKLERKALALSSITVLSDNSRKRKLERVVTQQTNKVQTFSLPRRPEVSVYHNR